MGEAGREGRRYGFRRIRIGIRDSKCTSYVAGVCAEVKDMMEMSVDILTI